MKLMRKMSLRDIQNVSIDILKEIDKFCLDNNIHYSLGYGGLIGAIRHKGCIPWDDDLDIIMPRPDYNKFISSYSNPNGNYKIYAPELGNCYYTVSRICEMKRTIVKKSAYWNDEDNGVWIDIFPIDGMVSDKQELWRMSAKCYVACRNKKVINTTQSVKYNLKSVALMMKYGLLKRRRCIENYMAAISRCNFTEAYVVGNYASPYRIKDVHRKDVFGEYIRVPFENTEISIIKNYDEYLTKIYGDYMQLPPEKDRGARSHASNGFFWR